jgi:hypothetical protein
MPAARATIAVPIRPVCIRGFGGQVETSLTPAERISLIGDEWAQVRSNKAPIGAYLDLVTAVKDDSGAEVMGTARTVSTCHPTPALPPRRRTCRARSLDSHNLCAPVRQARPSRRRRFVQHSRAARRAFRPPRLLWQRPCRHRAGAPIAAKYLSDPGLSMPRWARPPSRHSRSQRRRCAL